MFECKSAESLSKSLETVDALFLKNFAHRLKSCGRLANLVCHSILHSRNSFCSCACVCHVEGNYVTASNLGDSRAILGRLANRRLKKFTPIVLSEDQNTQNRKECELVCERSKDTSNPFFFKKKKIPPKKYWKKSTHANHFPNHSF